MAEDAAERLLDLYHATVTAGAYDPTGKTFSPSSGTVTGDLAVTGHFGCNGAAAQAKSAAYTKTYSTPGRTIPAATAVAVVTTGSTSTSPFGYSQAQADAIPVAINALEADVLALKQLIVALVTDLQANGIAG